jgi:hypothetical protein
VSRGETFAFIAAEKTTYGVRRLCRVLGVSKTAFYDWAARGGGPTEAELAEAYAIDELHTAWAEHRRTYGARRLTAEIRDRGHDWDRKRVARLMTVGGIEGVHRRRRDEGRPHHDDVHDACRAAALTDLDRGKELSAHAQFKVDTGIAVYFADPHSPWQRGTNENTNGLLRQYFPTGTDISRWNLEDLLAVQTAVNSRPRKVLGWKTPAEVLDEQLRLLHQAGVATTG